MKSNGKRLVGLTVALLALTLVAACGHQPGKRGPRPRLDRPAKPNLIARLDQDGDGAVSRKEWNSRFSRLDKNNDDRLSRSEIEDLLPNPPRR